MAKAAGDGRFGAVRHRAGAVCGEESAGKAAFMLNAEHEFGRIRHIERAVIFKAVKRGLDRIDVEIDGANNVRTNPANVCAGVGQAVGEATIQQLCIQADIAQKLLILSFGKRVG